MIPIVEEEEIYFKELGVYERCHFCNEPTKFWHDKTNTPVCQKCAKKHKERK